MRVVVPVSTGHIISDVFESSLQKQTVPCDLSYVENPVLYKGPRNPQGEEFRKRSMVIAESRNRCLPLLAIDDISVMQDSSLIHRNNDNLKDMLFLLLSDHRIAAVALAQYTRAGFPLDYFHIKHGCIMARRNVWENVKFEVPDGEFCTCLSFNRQVRQFGIYRYLDLDNERIRIQKS